MTRLGLTALLLLCGLGCEVVDPQDFDARLDRDGDGFDDQALGGEDCDDDDAMISPAQAEIYYDGIDQNCNGIEDDLDADGDGFDSAEHGGDDCNDDDAAIHPDAPEICDTIDNDCDAAVDDEDDDGPVENAATWYADEDGDSFGDPGQTAEACLQPTGYVADNTDCDDTNETYNPEATWYDDSDEDSYGDENDNGVICSPDDETDVLIQGDCDDNNPALHPLTIWYPDEDEDGYGVDQNTITQCEQPASTSPVYATEAGDCDDEDADELPNQTWYPDCDDDGFYWDVPIEQCERPDSDLVCQATGRSFTITAPPPTAVDCDDLNPKYTPDTRWYEDADADGYGSPAAVGEECAPSDPSHSSNNHDCDDTNPSYYPGVTWYEDADADGYGNDSVQSDCEPGDNVSNWARTGGDCFDGDAYTYPGAAPNDSVLACQTDADGDGFGDLNPMNNSINAGTDCDDSSAETYKGAAEYDSTTDCMRDEDQDGYGDSHATGSIIAGTDCHDEDDTSTTIDEDADCDGTRTDDDCDDTDYTSTIVANDADCDGIALPDDCDDNDPLSTAVALDADCDGVLSDDDCDDTEPTLREQLNDLDCDGILSADDCDDDDKTWGDRNLDVDCDGVLTDDDCNDSDSASTFIAIDADCDGTITDDDCDDNDSLSTTIANDADCDGIATADDCDDNDLSWGDRNFDADCDGVDLSVDCADDDVTKGDIAFDADCDGTLTDDDCDDNDAMSTTIANDADCDGTLTDDDCDDNNRSVGDPAYDADCDGTLTDDDCDDNDDTSTIIANDADCDGVLTDDDCNDNDETSTIIANDADCDGVLTDDDCNDNADTSTIIADDLDCDGLLNSVDDDADGDGFTSELSGGGDCDDTRADIFPSAQEYCNEYDHDCDGQVWFEEDVANDALAYYEDNDQDGFVNTDVPLCCLNQPFCFMPIKSAPWTPHDCDDNNASVNPDANEICGDGTDNNCDDIGIDGLTGSSCFWSTYLDVNVNTADQSIEASHDAPVDNGALYFGSYFGVDGEPDLVRGSIGAEEPSSGEQRGAIQLIRGGQVSLSSFGIEYGNTEGEKFGYSVSPSLEPQGELFYDELLVGAPGDYTMPGRVYLLTDPFSGNSTLTTLFTGSEAGDGYGQAMIPLTSSTNSSAPNHAIGAPRINTATSQAGYVDIVSDYGTNSNPSRGDAPYAPTVAATLTGEVGDAAGYALAYTDADRDQTRDLLIGAPRAQAGDGAVYIVHDLETAESGPLSGSYSKLVTTTDESWLGHALATCDMDGDGVEEIAISAPGDRANVPGRVYVVDSLHDYDLSSAPTINIDAAATYIIEDSTRALNNLGQTLHCDHDLDNDGFPDLVISDPVNASVYALIGARNYTGTQDIQTIMADPNFHSTTFTETADLELGTRVVTGHMDTHLTADICFTSPASNAGDGQLLCFSGEGF